MVEILVYLNGKVVRRVVKATKAEALTWALNENFENSAIVLIREAITDVSIGTEAFGDFEYGS